MSELPDAATKDLAKAILSSTSSRTLDLPNDRPLNEIKAELAAIATPDAWCAYDLVHQLQVFGRAF